MKGPPGRRGAQELLSVFAIAAFVELTEKWQKIPAPHASGTRLVNNMDASEA